MRKVDRKDSQKIRKRVADTITKLKTLLKDFKGEDYQRRLIIGLFWFVYVTNAKGQPIPIKAASSLEDNGLKDFIRFLNNEGGLGMSQIGKDVLPEATALQTVLEKKGHCTE